MNGSYTQKFPQARALYLYMMVHPGRKLNFMGNEIAQIREWDEKRSQDWDLRQYPLHDAFYHFIIELNHLYLAHSALWEEDHDPSGFRWLDCHQESSCVYILQRQSRKELLIAAFNLREKTQTAKILESNLLITIPKSILIPCKAKSHSVNLI